MSKYYIVGKNVLNKGYALISDGMHFSITEGTTAKDAIAIAVKSTLEGAVVLNNDGLAPVMTTLYVADTVGKVLSHGTVGEWLRTGRTSKGNPLTEAELFAVRDAFIALTSRNFNARVVAFGDMGNSDITGRSMVQTAWAALDRHIATIAPQQMNLGYGTMPTMGMGLGMGTNPMGGVVQQQPQQPQAGAVDMNAMMAQMQQMMMQMMGGQIPQMQQPVQQQPVQQQPPTSVADILSKMGVGPREESQNTGEQPAADSQEDSNPAE